MAADLLRLMDATPEDRLGLSNFAVEALHITVLALRTASTPTPTQGRGSGATAGAAGVR
jgi:hypothetical protein